MENEEFQNYFTTALTDKELQGEALCLLANSRASGGVLNKDKMTQQSTIMQTMFRCVQQSSTMGNMPMLPPIPQQLPPQMPMMMPNMGMMGMMQPGMGMGGAGQHPMAMMNGPSHCPGFTPERSSNAGNLLAIENRNDRDSPVVEDTSEKEDSVPRRPLKPRHQRNMLDDDTPTKYKTEQVGGKIALQDGYISSEDRKRVVYRGGAGSKGFDPYSLADRSDDDEEVRRQKKTLREAIASKKGYQKTTDREYKTGDARKKYTATKEPMKWEDMNEKQQQRELFRQRQKTRREKQEYEKNAADKMEILAAKMEKLKKKTQFGTATPSPGMTRYRNLQTPQGKFSANKNDGGMSQRSSGGGKRGANDQNSQSMDGFRLPHPQNKDVANESILVFLIGFSFDNFTILIGSILSVCMNKTKSKKKS